jgi:RHS repeat-associated protein
VQAQDYYAFGAAMEGRSFSISAYRFGFQGMEKEGELYGDGNAYTTQYRMLDVRIGRWFSTDPVVQPWMSPYTSMDNNPIWMTDPFGLKAKAKAGAGDGGPGGSDNGGASEDIDLSGETVIEAIVIQAEPIPPADPVSSGPENSPATETDPSTFVDEKGNVVGGDLNDGDRSVYQVKGLRASNFDASKIDQYKLNGTKLGQTLSIYSFYNNSTHQFQGNVSPGPDSPVRDLIVEATDHFSKVIATRSLPIASSTLYYMRNAGNGKRYDLKTYGMPTGLSKSSEQEWVYSASYFRGIIMTRRDAGNFFAGRAANMLGLSESVMLSGFGAYDNSGNKLGPSFAGKSFLNYIDALMLGTAIEYMPTNQIRWVPPFSEYKGSRDAQIIGFKMPVDKDF